MNQNKELVNLSYQKVTKIERNRIKKLVTLTFWQFENLPLESITPRLFRSWVIRNLHPKLIESTGVNIVGSDFWYRVEKLCLLCNQLKFWSY